MPTYTYKAKRGPDQTVESELTADSRAAALLEIDGMGYSPVWVREKTDTDTGAKRRVSIRRRIRYRDVTILTRQLASMIRAGVPILKSLATIAGQTENARLSSTVTDIQSAIRDGSMLSDALSRYPALFSELYVNMVRSGESAGVLDTCLFRLADAREREEDIRRRVQAAMAYPVLILTVGVATVFMLLAFFLPRIMELFQDYPSLPLPTRMLISTSQFCSDNWYWIVIMLVLLWAIFKRLTALDRGRTMVDTLILKVPVIGKFVRQADIGRFARTLALLLEAGVAIDRSLLLSADTLKNAVLRAEIGTVRENTIQRGFSLSAGLKRTRYFPEFVANMCAVGEEAGRLDEALSEVASFYEKEVEQSNRVLTSLIEPILILVVGLIVGLIVAAMLLPIFEMGTSVR